jgi:GntR family transcriptional regulator
VTAYARIVEDIREAIASQVYITGERLPTQKDMSARYGVGSATVSHAVRLLQDEGLVYTSPRGVYVGRPS